MAVPGLYAAAARSAVVVEPAPKATELAAVALADWPIATDDVPDADEVAPIAVALEFVAYAFAPTASALLNVALLPEPRAVELKADAVTFAPRAVELPPVAEAALPMAVALATPAPPAKALAPMAVEAMLAALAPSPSAVLFPPCALAAVPIAVLAFVPSVPAAVVYAPTVCVEPPVKMFSTVLPTVTLFAKAPPGEARHTTPAITVRLFATAAPITRFDLLRLPRDVVNSDAATHDPRDSFQTLLYDLFTIDAQ